MSQHAGDKPSLKGACSGSSNQFSNFTPHEISSEWLKLETSNFVHGLATRSTNLQMTNCPRSGRGKGKVFTARAYARAVLGVVILSVRLSYACIVTKLNDAPQIFLYHTKGQSLRYSDTKSGWSAMPPSLWNLRSKWPPPSKNADFDRFPLITSQP